jgi:hypothetical protein
MLHVVVPAASPAFHSLPCIVTLLGINYAVQMTPQVEVGTNEIRWSQRAHLLLHSSICNMSTIGNTRTLYELVDWMIVLFRIQVLCLVTIKVYKVHTFIKPRHLCFVVLPHSCHISPTEWLRLYIFFSFSGWGETESTWCVGQYLGYCTSPGW